MKVDRVCINALVVTFVGMTIMLAIGICSIDIHQFAETFGSSEEIVYSFKNRNTEVNTLENLNSHKKIRFNLTYLSNFEITVGSHINGASPSWFQFEQVGIHLFPTVNNYKFINSSIDNTSLLNGITKFHPRENSPPDYTAGIYLDYFQIDGTVFGVPCSCTYQSSICSSSVTLTAVYVS